MMVRTMEMAELQKQRKQTARKTIDLNGGEQNLI